MAFSKITFTFSEVPTTDQYIWFQDLANGMHFKETFKPIRLGLETCTLPSLSGGSYTTYVVEWLRNAFQLDYPSAPYLVSITLGASGSGIGSITITAKNTSAQFAGINNTTTAVQDIDNGSGTPDMVIESVAFETATGEEQNKCLVVVDTNNLATKILQPFVLNGNTENPFSFTKFRNVTFNLEVQDVDFVKVLRTVTTPSYLSALNFNTLINNSPNGATVIFTEIVPTQGLELEYSLDADTFQTSNVFPGLDVGDFTVTIKDQLGWQITIDFSVVENNVYVPYFSISKSNSFRLANRISFGDSENYKNDENTLSCEVDVEAPYKEIQQFQSADVITTQFKCNYTTNVATIVKSDLSEVDVPVIKKTSFIGIKDKRDALKYNLGDNKTGIYFKTGNTYDFDTGADNDVDYILNGALPPWGEIGNYIQIAGAWFRVDDIVFDDAKNADVLVISNAYTGDEVSIIVGSIYNFENFEVYEFTIDMVDYIDQYFRVRINNTDPNFPEIIHLSEEIWCKVKHDDVLEIKYRNTTNTDVYYSTGIEHLIRIPYTTVKGKDDSSSETHKTDTNAVLLNADIYEAEEFVFEPVTKEIWRKMKQALSHEIVAINGVGYVKNGDFNTEGPLEKSNLYVLTATMIKTGNVYNSQNSGGLGFSGSEIEVPGLISTETGFVSY